MTAATRHDHHHGWWSYSGGNTHTPERSRIWLCCTFWVCALRPALRSGTKITLLASPQDFQGLTQVHRTPREARCFTETTTYLRHRAVRWSSICTIDTCHTNDVIQDVTEKYWMSHPVFMSHVWLSTIRVIYCESYNLKQGRKLYWQGRNVHFNVHSQGRNVQGTKCPGGETSRGETSRGQTSKGRNVHKPL